MFIGKRGIENTLYFVEEDVDKSTKYLWTKDVNKATQFTRREDLRSSLKRSGLDVLTKIEEV